MSSGSSMFTSCVNSSAKAMPVNGDRIVPPRIAPMLTSGQKPTPMSGSIQASMPPSAPPIMSNGASTPPEVPEPSEIDQIAALTMRIPTRARPEPEQVATSDGTGGARERHGHETARLPLKQQQLHREQHRRHRRRERRGHAGGRACYQQRLAFGVGEVEELRDERSNRSARHD